MKHDGLRRLASKMNLNTIEIDYAISVFLTLLSYYPLCTKLVFKGGTSIKKTLYPEFRFSTDLDFKVIGNEKNFNSELAAFFGDLIKFDIDGFRFTKIKEENTKAPNKVFSVSYRFEDEQEETRKQNIRIDLNRTTKLFEDPEWRNLILTPYDFKFKNPCKRLAGGPRGHFGCKLGNFANDNIIQCNDCPDFVPETKYEHSIQCMKVNEILAEKFHALFNPKRLKARDIFDIDYILTKEKNILLDKNALNLIRDKIEERDGEFNLKNIGQKIEDLRENWANDMSGLLMNQPPFDEIKSRIIKKMEQCF